MTVYVLFNGSYSDVRVVAVCSTRRNADALALVFTDDAYVKEFDLDSGVEAVRSGWRPYFVRLARTTGERLECHVEGSSYGAFSRSVGEDVHKDLYTNCFALSDAHAVKIASDRRRAFLAGEPMPEDAVDPHDGSTHD